MNHDFPNPYILKKIRILSLNIFFSMDLKKDGSFGSPWG